MVGRTLLAVLVMFGGSLLLGLAIGKALRICGGRDDDGSDAGGEDPAGPLPPPGDALRLRAGDADDAGGLCVVRVRVAGDSGGGVRAESVAEGHRTPTLVGRDVIPARERMRHVRQR